MDARSLLYATTTPPATVWVRPEMEVHSSAVRRGSAAPPPRLRCGTNTRTNFIEEANGRGTVARGCPRKAVAGAPPPPVRLPRVQASHRLPGPPVRAVAGRGHGGRDKRPGS
jgi:hypothetical protein